MTGGFVHGQQSTLFYLFFLLLLRKVRVLCEKKRVIVFPFFSEFERETESSFCFRFKETEKTIQKRESVRTNVE